jgi:hypothetical protein
VIDVVLQLLVLVFALKGVARALVVTVAESKLPTVVGIHVSLIYS